MLDRYLNIRGRTVEICAPLEIEDYIPQPVDYVSPAKWHLAHTTWFFEQMILDHVEGYKVFDADYSYLFNSYYNTVGSRTLRADRGNMTRPTVEQIYKYRAYVDKAMSDLLSKTNDPEVLGLVELGLNHEQQHQELLWTDLKYILGHNPTFPVYQQQSSLVDDENEEEGWLSIEEGIYHIGHSGDGFCFDNELGQHKVYLEGFEIAKGLVTNGEYIEFIEDGAYQRFNLWLDEGWAWVNNNEVGHPMHWHKIDGKWHQFTFGGLKEVRPDAILSHVSFYEASAYANWKDNRLPTESEWEIASEQIRWGKRWEWTNSAYLAYPGFKVAEGAVGEYNGKFMINQMVLRGASVATSEGHSRKTYRNFFHPHFQWQFSGIRLVK